MLGNEEIIHFETHSNSLLFTQLSQYTHMVQFLFLHQKRFLFSLGMKKKKGSIMSTHFTSWNKEDVVHVFTVAVTVSSGVLTPAKKDNHLKPKKHIGGCVFN